jgi:hypothetical protein
MSWKDEKPERKPDDRPMCKRCFRPMKVLFQTDWYCPNCELNDSANRRNKTVEIDPNSGTDSTGDFKFADWPSWPGLNLMEISDTVQVEISREHLVTMPDDEFKDFMEAIRRLGLTLDGEIWTDSFTITKKKGK